MTTRDCRGAGGGAAAGGSRRATRRSPVSVRHAFGSPDGAAVRRSAVSLRQALCSPDGARWASSGSSRAGGGQPADGGAGGAEVGPCRTGEIGSSEKPNEARELAAAGAAPALAAAAGAKAGAAPALGAAAGAKAAAAGAKAAAAPAAGTKAACAGADAGRTPDAGPGDAAGISVPSVNQEPPVVVSAGG
ncbi:hypothetical protein ACFQS1_21180 [Paractinoplanes rhizophilus]|uniref:Antifreeze protein n=1 Tax=Paractinoplanes rhizophilus TaxID=1416877 RepID=A0ABW2HWM2_9ACTN